MQIAFSPLIIIINTGKVTHKKKWDDWHEQEIKIRSLEYECCGYEEKK